MATKTTTITEVECDRCSDTIAKPVGGVSLNHGGPKLEAGAGPESIRMADLCKDCMKSLHLWWTRPERTSKAAAE